MLWGLRLLLVQTSRKEDESYIVANCYERVMCVRGQAWGRTYSWEGKGILGSQHNLLWCSGWSTYRGRYKTAKEMWNTLNIEYGGSDAGTKVYIIE
jgi:hypothetical protein